MRGFFMDKKINIKSWLIVAAFVLASPLVLELSFKNEILEYQRNKEVFQSLLLDVENFKKTYHPKIISKGEYKQYSDEFSTYVGNKYKTEKFDVLSAEIQGGLFKVVIEIEPSLESCNFRKEAASTLRIVQLLDVNTDCKNQSSKLLFGAL